MNAFAYVTPRSVESAVELARDGGRYLAGGIDLLGQLKENLSEPRILVNVKALPGTREITPGRKQWMIGANATLAELAGHAELRRTFPGLAEAADEVGSPQMRNVNGSAQHVSADGRKERF